MKIQHKVFLGVGILAALVVVVAVIYSLLPREAEAEKITPTATFEFDAAKAPGWFAGDNIDGDAINADAAPTSIKMATTTRIIAQGTANNPGGNCFVQYSYWANNTKDIDQVRKDLAAPSDPSTAGSFTLQLKNTVSLAMKTPAGNTPFELGQYDITGPDAARMSTGEAIGVLKAGTGYIDIKGYCKTVDELPVTLPVFAAVSFKL